MEKQGILGGTAQRFFDIIGEIAGFLTILLIVFLFANAQWDFINNQSLLDTLYIIEQYAIIITVSVVCLEFATKRGWIFFFIACGLVAIVIIFSFMPGVQDKITSVLQLIQ